MSVDVVVQPFHAVTYTGDNGAAVLGFLAGVEGRVWKTLSQDPAQVVFEGVAAEDQSAVVTVEAGQTLTKQTVGDATSLSGPWEHEDFKARFCHVASPGSVASADDVAGLAGRVAAIEQVLSWPLSVQARLGSPEES